MFSKKLYRILNLILLSISFQIHAQTQLKFNIVSTVLLVPNFGIELPIIPHATFQLDVLGSFWDSFNKKPLHVVQVIPEFRYYSNKNTKGFFIGTHAGFGMFTIQKPSFNIVYDAYQNPATYRHNKNNYQSGRVAFYGITLGYKKYINTNWGIEAFLGGGLTQSNYKGYDGMYRTDVSLENYRNFNRSGEVALYRGGIMLVYKLKQ